MASLSETLFDFGYSRVVVEAEIRMARQLVKDYLAESDSESALNVCEELWGLGKEYLKDVLPDYIM